MRLRKSFWLLPLLVLSCVFLLTAAIPNVPTGTWQTWNAMGDVRSGAAAVLLQDGRVLIVGGNNAIGPVASADLFGTDGSFSAAAAMQTPRSGHTATVLSDGRVLVAGGITSGGGAVNTAEIYDPNANSWSAPATMVNARAGHTASLLSDNRVLLGGGHDSSGNALSSMEIFDPTSGAFSSTGAMSSPRMNFAAATLGDGRVLLIGGTVDGTTALNSIDIYDPSTGMVSAGPALSVARISATATSTLDGKVAVIGGNNGAASGSQDLASAEIFDPATGQLSLSASNLVTARSGHQAFLLPKNNAILVLGGSSSANDLNSAELYYSWADTFQATGSMSVPRPGLVGSATSQDGVFLAAGGTNLSSTELYGFATVKTDAADYPPGTTVTITGSGWQPGETVTLTLVESPLIDTHGPYTAIADANGNISNSSFVTDDHDQSIRFYLTAVGSASQWQAQNTFTDSKPNTVTVGAQSPNPVAPGSSTQFTVTVNFNGSGTNCTSPLSVTTALPTGATAAFNPASVTGSGGANVNSTLTISTTNATPPGSTNFTVLAGNGAGCQAGTATGTGTLVVVENTTTTLASPINPTVFGQATTLTATVANVTGPTTPTGGTVTFKDGATTLGTVTLAAGTATLLVSNLTVAGSPHSLTASYAGVANTFGASSSNTVSQLVDQASTTTSIALTSGTNPSVFGQSLTFTATVTAVAPGAGTPTGTVTFKDGATTLGTISLTGNTAPFTTTTLSVGGHSITATYNADANFTGSTSSTLPQTVNLASTTTVITSHTPSPSVVGQAVTINFTVTAVAPGSGTPTGNVNVSDGAGDSCSASVGTGSCAITFTTAGAKSLTASYPGDTNFTGSTSSPATSHTVNAASTTTTITAHTPNPSVIGQPITVTFSVTVNSPGSGTIPGTDTVSVSDGTGGICSGTLAAGTCQLTPATSGAKTLTATFAGDTNFATSTSAGVPHTVN
jgi:N-acetylneuraminic acid mutarotase